MYVCNQSASFGWCFRRKENKINKKLNEINLFQYNITNHLSTFYSIDIDMRIPEKDRIKWYEERKKIVITRILDKNTLFHLWSKQPFHFSLFFSSFFCFVYFSCVRQMWEIKQKTENLFPNKHKILGFHVFLLNTNIIHEMNV